jgi:hypothetical protein
MMKIGFAEIPTGIAPAFSNGRRKIPRILCISQVDSPLVGEQLSVSSISGGQNAIEQIVTYAYGKKQIFRGSGSH